MAIWYVGSTKWSAIATWAALHVYSIGDFVRAQPGGAEGNERAYRCTTGGTSAASPPSFPTGAGSTVTEVGGVVWTEVTGQSAYGWSACHAYLKNCYTSGWAAAGDTIYVSNNDNESMATATNLISPGTATNPCFVICVNDAAAPPTAVATGGRIASTFNLNFGGSAYYYGLTFAASTGSANGIMDLTQNNSNVIIMDTCALRIEGGGSAETIQSGPRSSATSEYLLKLLNTTVFFSHIGQKILCGGKLIWRNTPSAILGTIPTTLFASNTTVGAFSELAGVDLSALGTGRNIIDVSVGQVHRMFLRNCKLGSAVSVITNAITGDGGSEVYLENCDSANTNYRMEHYRAEGSIVQETVIVRTGGASDGVTPLSWKLVSLANKAFLYLPLETAPIMVWSNTAGAHTATLEFLHDSLTALTNGEIYAEVEYLGTANFPESVFLNNRVANLLTATAAQPSSVASWTTTGITNPNKQQLQVSFTTQQKGAVRIRVYLCKPNYTVYLDPLITLT